MNKIYLETEGQVSKKGEQNNPTQCCQCIVDKGSLKYMQYLYAIPRLIWQRSYFTQYVALQFSCKAVLLIHI